MFRDSLLIFIVFFLGGFVARDIVIHLAQLAK